MSAQRCKWTESEPEACAIVWDDYPNYIGVHTVAFVCIVATIIGSTFVLVRAYREKTYTSFADRLPLYRCLADLIFATVHTLDHVVVVSAQRYPAERVGAVLATLIFCFIAYQMLVTTVLSFQSFLKVVVGREFPLGAYEYRLHLMAIMPGLLIFGTANILNGTGPFLYFQGPNLQVGTAGRIYGWFAVAFFISVICIVLATSTLTVRHVNKVRNGMGQKKSAAQMAASAGTERAVRRLQSFVIAACLQWFPCSVLLTAIMADGIAPYGFRMFLIYIGVAGANLGGVWNSAA
ncbi:uncharacterized protein EV422DRAFT_95838 [Fimicolochytrium jonesii]|uniref:uncharacterized protein n=1 Tax=Fimicolochytrium jonesii TaxID=1396493 RepID=UPI0022FE18D5|nr:uncharacterized protein EV422DRAFT_95838 [Fimicolochytrium jonesii]KAI8820024.1 hypothetical protein EV422DRAFT_95838 [Fimicolochytrium jonesii]